MSPTDDRRYALISCDAHAGGRMHDYKAYLAREFHDDFEAWAATFHDPWGDYDRELTDTDDDGLRIGMASFESPYNWESALRLEHMDRDGIAAEVVFPNTVPPFYPSSIISAPGPRNAEEYARRFAGIQAHNRWLVDFCSEAPLRRGGLAQVFLDDLDDAIAEASWAKEHGLVGVLIPSDHTEKLVDLYGRELDPFWAACQDLELPVHRHSQGVGPKETPERGPATTAVGAHETHMFYQRGLAHLMFGGVFERFPALRFVFTETGLFWIPGELFKLDREFEIGRRVGHAAYPMYHRALEGLALQPSEYFARNVWVGASLMLGMDIAIRDQVGVDKIMWGADYPHHEGTFPRTTLALRLLFSDVPEQEVRAMTSLNAAELYGFDLAALQPIADEIGPTPEQIATPVSRDELPPHSVTFTIQDAIEPFANSL
jgi:predicted TIM-barrel fold metal-dependent hydrolase